MSRLAFLASCLLSAHYALLLYMILKCSHDVLLLEMIFATGILGISFLCATKYPYNHPLASSNVVVSGMTTFYVSALLNSINPVASSVFRMMLVLVYYLSGIRTVRGRYIEVEKVYLRNAFFTLLSGIMNIIYALGLIHI
ncbi:MAG: hypothetical protein DRG31_02385 [Deltaproteobacteria bacterium]|nr:MAG: hypothetical protein DRG31_02385 [Deltaproteobacteria bacterium]